jgi:hypothetical protein
MLNKTFIYSVGLVVPVVLLTGCLKMAAINESLDWQPLQDFAPAQKTGTGWKGIRGDETFRIVYLRNPETSSTWTIKAESLQLPIAATNTGAFHWNPKSVMAWLKANVESQKCATDRWTLLEQGSASLLYEWEDISCRALPTQHEIVRIVMGQWYLWVISYGIRNGNAPASERDKLISNLKGAFVSAKASTRP